MVQKPGGRAAPLIAIRDLRLACSGAILAVTGSVAWGSAAPSGMLNLLAGHEAHLRGASPLLRKVQADAVDFKVANATGPAGRPIPIKIEVSGPADRSAGQLFIFSGIPSGVALSPGGNFGDFWAVNASVIKDLTIIAPPTFAGTFTMWVTRSRDQAGTARSVPITVSIGGPDSVPTVAATPNAAPPTIRDTPAPKPRPSVPPANEQMLLSRAADSFKKGDVSGARVIYEYLAMQGSSAAAMAMGESYDPLVLAKMVVKGLEADPRKAQQWYEKAEELGSREARSRLNALAAR